MKDFLIKYCRSYKASSSTKNEHLMGKELYLIMILKKGDLFISVDLSKSQINLFRIVISVAQDISKISYF